MAVVERFKKLFQWNLDKYASDFVRIKNNDLFYDQNHPQFPKLLFGIRTLSSSLWTTCLATYMEAQGCFEIDRMATLKEDTEEGIDLLLVGGFAQFKIRQFAYPDFGAVRWQPCYGLGHPLTEDGRDYRTLRDDRTKYYFSALYNGSAFTEVLRVDSSEFWGKVKKLDEDWGQTPLNSKDRHWPRADGAEVVWQKNEKNYHKYNFYFPPASFESLVRFTIPEKKQQVLQQFYNEAWQYAKQTFM